jgi:hypothetical protein
MSEDTAAPADAGQPGDGGQREGGGQFSEVGAEASRVVRNAAEILESEMSGGIEETRRLQRRFIETRRLEDGDLDEVADRLRRTGHQMIDMLSERASEMGSGDVQDLAARFGKDAHEVLDGLIDLVGLAPRVVNTLMEQVDATGNQRSDPSPAGDDSGA